ncbi:MAG: methyltransferase domain-containing protein [Leptospiraceae bacterium]|nr:methyltransferase domain-containing protein [Leptospiraceae bacterium]MCP5510735.1 methyltransferase domain-containing protein [Leptospiraceae bacterium]
MTNPEYTQSESVAQEYYNSSEADEFYFNIWGGEDIHIGMYDTPDSPIAPASKKTVTFMSDRITGANSETRLIDLGSGYGGAARYLHKKFGVHVSCLNISEAQNARNRKFNSEQNLNDWIGVTDGSFEKIPFKDSEFDIAWSQDALLHSSEKETVFKEIHRVLKQGGELIFTDPMQAGGVKQEDLQPVLDRIHLESMGSFEFYQEVAQKVGFETIEIIDLSDHLGFHYSAVLKEVEKRYDEIVKISNQAYIDKMKIGLNHWISAYKNGLLNWGVLRFKKV